MDTRCPSKTRPTVPGLLRALLMTLIAAVIVPVWLLSPVTVAVAQISQWVDIGPTSSDLDSTGNPDPSNPSGPDPDGASGGRVNGLASVAGNILRFYAATEWGGLYVTNDQGLTWQRLNRHLPVATWDVEVDPTNTQIVYATSFYDGRVNSLAGINVSTDGGNTWIHPVTATPPATFTCRADTPGLPSARPNEPSAFGIGIRPDAPQNVAIGTNCGVAISTDFGTTWMFVDPTPGNAADDVWDVVYQRPSLANPMGIIDICGDDRHRRSTDGGMNWTGGSTNLPAGRCSIAVSPDEPNVLFVAAMNNNLYESDNGGASWTNLGTPDSARQGRIPFAATNQRSDIVTQIGFGQIRQDVFDLWFGDVGLFRGSCLTSLNGVTLPGTRCPAGRTTPASPPPTGWAGPFTRSAGAHDDAGDIAFDPAATDACPRIFSSDGGVYVNLIPPNFLLSCQNPFWEQPATTPRALWLFAMDGVDQTGPTVEDLYFGVQDNGSFAATNAPSGNPTWSNKDCCDVFDIAADANRVVYTVCCFNGATRLFLRNRGMTGGGQINTPAGILPGFRPIDAIARFANNQYVLVTTAGVFITTNITANPVVWVPLGTALNPPIGTATSPPNACGVKVAVAGGTPTFYVQAGICNERNMGNNADQLWSYTGPATNGTWQQVLGPGIFGPANWIGIFAVDPKNPNQLYASNIRAAGAGGPQMVFSNNGGNTWATDANLDTLMTGSQGGSAVFQYMTQRGPSNFTGFTGYPQPTLLAFDPENGNIIVAGGRDSGVFLSTDGGQTWGVVTDPFNSGNSGIPHLPRPWFAYFDHEPSGRLNLYIGTQGRGVWRITMALPSVSHMETQTGGSSASTQVQTSRNLTSVPGDLYLAAISTKPDIDVLSVTGLGLTWARMDSQCGFRQQTRVDLFMGTGTPTGDGPVTATLASSSTLKNAVIAVSRYSFWSGVGSSVTANTNGVGGACAKSSDRSVDTADYSVPVQITAANSIAYGAVAIRLRRHTAGSGFTQRAVVYQPPAPAGLSDGDAAGLAIEDQLIATPSTVPVNGTLNRATDWAVIAVEIRGQ